MSIWPAHQPLSPAKSMNQNQADSGIPLRFNRKGKCSSVRSVSCSSGRASRGSRPTAGNLSTLRRAPTRQFLTLFPVPRSVVSRLLSGSSWFAPRSVIWRCTEWDSGGMCAPSA
jgi:hypothetical protein